MNTQGTTWALMALAVTAILATGTAQHRLVSTPQVNQPTCISQTMEIVPCP